MKETETFTVYPENEAQTNALKAFMEALHIPFKNNEKSPYTAEFEAKMRRGKNEITQGKGINMSLDDFDKLCE